MNKWVSSNRQQRWISSSSYQKLWTPRTSRHIPSLESVAWLCESCEGVLPAPLLHGRPRYLLSGSPNLITTTVAKPPAAQQHSCSSSQAILSFTKIPSSCIHATVPMQICRYHLLFTSSSVGYHRLDHVSWVIWTVLRQWGWCKFLCKNFIISVCAYSHILNSGRLLLCSISIFCFVCLTQVSCISHWICTYIAEFEFLV